VFGVAIFSSCEKHRTDAEHQAEIDAEVQRRLEAEHQAQEKEQLAQREADVNAREQALAQTESTAARATPQARPDQGTTRSSDALEIGSYQMFYTRLEPHGIWRETSTYGYVW